MADIPQGVSVDVHGSMVTVKGPKGSLQKAFNKTVSIKVAGSAVEVSGANPAYVGTVESLISCMCRGAKDGYKRSMKIVYAHFPVTLEIKGKDVLIKNFLGEKEPRRTRVIGDATKVEVKGQSVTISGNDKEAVGQTAANLKSAMRIRDKDARVFQDGIYDVEG